MTSRRAPLPHLSTGRETTWTCIGLLTDACRILAYRSTSYVPFYVARGLILCVAFTWTSTMAIEGAAEAQVLSRFDMRGG